MHLISIDSLEVVTLRLHAWCSNYIIHCIYRLCNFLATDFEGLHGIILNSIKLWTLDIGKLWVGWYSFFHKNFSRLYYRYVISCQNCKCFPFISVRIMGIVIGSFSFWEQDVEKSFLGFYYPLWYPFWAILCEYVIQSPNEIYEF